MVSLFHKPSLEEWEAYQAERVARHKRILREKVAKEAAEKAPEHISVRLEKFKKRKLEALLRAQIEENLRAKRARDAANMAARHRRKAAEYAARAAKEAEERKAREAQLEAEKRAEAEARAERDRIAQAKRAEMLLHKWPEHKLRRTRADWTKVVPQDVAVRQVAFEKSETALAMREAGMTLKQIGEKFGVSVERARQIVARAERRRMYGRTPVSPISAYLAEPTFETASKNEAQTHVRTLKTVETAASGITRDWLFL